MGPFALLLVAAVGWLWWKGHLGRDSGRKLALAGGAGLSAWLMARGQTLPALGLAAATVALGFGGWMRAKVSAIPMDELEARQLLGLPLRASTEEIQQAHRRLITAAHPDRGGDPELARRLNAARDLLIGINKSRG
ncbi:molecular chaperone DnaJ [Sandaracinobacter neustonicus]|uniref:Molecular chaperone DnaJ n=1 Tax=Sandaracinobacter neustonicus TaxID=1715348 RepID=A0A501XKT9_9SPHN|nr:molecular chaperone DnaJ [Sandaracinobacter neustonicus]TPE61065.1 molecular chaperone DnaJ [Sandaracinobacter neustonicus]